MNKTGGFGFNKLTFIGLGYLLLFELFARGVNYGVGKIQPLVVVRLSRLKG